MADLQNRDGGDTLAGRRSVNDDVGSVEDDDDQSEYRALLNGNRAGSHNYGDSRNVIRRISYTDDADRSTNYQTNPQSL